MQYSKEINLVSPSCAACPRLHRWQGTQPTPSPTPALGDLNYPSRGRQNLEIWELPGDLYNLRTTMVVGWLIFGGVRYIICPLYVPPE